LYTDERQKGTLFTGVMGTFCAAREYIWKIDACLCLIIALDELLVGLRQVHKEPPVAYFLHGWFY